MFMLSIISIGLINPICILVDNTEWNKIFSLLTILSWYLPKNSKVFLNEKCNNHLFAVLCVTGNIKLSALPILFGNCLFLPSLLLFYVIFILIIETWL